MKRNKIQLSEHKLHKIIKESVRAILREDREDFTYNNVASFLEDNGFQDIMDYEVEDYLERNDMPIPFEKKIWDDEGQIVVEVDLYPMGDGSDQLYSAVCKYGHGDYDIDDEEGNSEDVFTIDELRDFMEENDVLRWD